MTDRQPPSKHDPVAGEPRPRRFETVAEMWLSDDPPWDRDVADNIDELAWRLGELRAMSDALRGWARLR